MFHGEKYFAEKNDPEFRRQCGLYRRDLDECGVLKKGVQNVQDSKEERQEFCSV